jgi:F-type H+-transporting ATPase subunit b
MPQLNPLDWGPQLIWLLNTFGILYVLMLKVALPRIGTVIEARADRIAKDLREADRLRRETAEAIAAYEQTLAEAKQKAHAIIEEGRDKLKAESAAERVRTRRRARRERRGSREAHHSGARMPPCSDVNEVAARRARRTSCANSSASAPSKPEIAQAVAAARKD